jgi:tetratricopeptide (TPR) repeat protein
MPEPTSDRLKQLFSLLEKTPADTFLLYGIGMEYKKLGEPDQAIGFFNRVIETDPGYCYAYYQRAQVQEHAGRSDEAKQSYREGIAAARRIGDAHALSELEAALELLD